MTTAEAIEGITSAGDFEILATRVLRITDEDCRLLEHMGVNAAGKTVANPIDSFCRVPGTDPPRFVMAAFTTDKVESLDRKWLFDHSAAPNAKKATAADDGDLLKASRRAEALRKDHPAAVFVVHLCTNKQPDDQMIAKVIKRGQEFSLDIRFLTRSRLRDILDVTPDGQWLRKEHLGIQAERLSFTLLRELSVKSLFLFGSEFLITPPEAFIVTTSERALAASLTPSRSLYVVTGASGSGKSVACYQVLRNHLDQGGVGLWIPGELVARATSLNEAIDLTLRSLHPTLEPSAATVALSLVSPFQRLVVVIDDINRSGTPGESLRKLLAWSHASHGTKESVSPCGIIVPAWDLFWAPLDRQFSTASWIARIPINKMEEAEAIACLTAAIGSQVQCFCLEEQRQIVEALGHDPILIALYASSLKEQGQLHPPALAIEIIERFVQTAQAEAATAGPFLYSEYDSALSHLAARMLDQRELYPRWEDLQEWLPADKVNAIREVARLGKVCRVTGRAGENRFEFRHDRILEHFLVRALQPLLSDLESHADIVTEPFYASFVGRALALSQPSDEDLAWMQQYAPLALLSSLHFLPPVMNHLGNRILDAAKHWLETASKDRHTPSMVLFEAYHLLEAMDTPHLLTITQSLSQHRLLARARLANGDAAAGAIALSSGEDFAPAVNDRWLDAVLSRAFHRHKQSLISQCFSMLERTDLEEGNRRGALVLAGFLADSALAVPVRTAWDHSVDKRQCLLPALWAGLRCAAHDPASIMDGMMASWAALPDNETGAGISERSWVSHELQFAVPRGIPESVLNYMLTQARANETLHWPILFTLEHVVHPIAVTFLVHEAAETEGQIKRTGGFSLLSMTLRDRWDPLRDTRGKRLPSASVQAIRFIWDSETAQPQVRETAFSFWVNAIDDLEMLRAIPADHPQFKKVLWRRARLGDLSTATLIKPLIDIDNNWFRVLHEVWTEQFTDSLDKALLILGNRTATDYTGGTTNDHFMLAHLLRDIPQDQSQTLLMKHWDHLKFSPLFVQAALYIGSPECAELASKIISSYPNSTDPFQHVGHFFGFFVAGLMDRLKQQHLEVLLPYLSKLDHHSLTRMIDFCEHRNLHAWSLYHLKPELDQRRAQSPPESAKEKREFEFIVNIAKRHFPSDIDLIEKLDWIEQQERYSGHIYHWSEEFERRQDDHVRWQRILVDWFSQKPTIDRFRIFAEAILRHGTRNDIDMLYKLDISDHTDEVEKLRANAKFSIKSRSLR